ncbi:MAG: type II toxin-antitoxin system HicB family antitoxin [Candidatus Omnitrophica bacterium]|nr:type II toxin-antitoxin system HicB family antitoxin [Candidatus Omnitrophota bacterium]
MKSVTAYIHKGEKYYVGECLEIDVITQGKTIDEVINNLHEATELYFEDEKKKLYFTDDISATINLGVAEYAA